MRAQGLTYHLLEVAVKSKTCTENLKGVEASEGKRTCKLHSTSALYV